MRWVFVETFGVAILLWRWADGFGHTFISNDPSQSVLNHSTLKANDSGHRSLYMEGDLIMGGLFSIRHGKECAQWTNPSNIQLVEAMLYAIGEINKNSTLLPNITVGAHIHDDCLSGTIALEKSLDFVLNAFGHNENTCLRQGEKKQPVVGVVGTGSSRTSLPVASLLRLFRLPQVSYAATSPDLSDRDDYTYFTRTVPSDLCQAEALHDIITYLNWTAVFVVSSSGNYGQRIKEAFVRGAKNRSLCIVKKMEINREDNQEKIESFLLEANKSANVRGFVLLTETFHTKVVLETVKTTGIRRDRFLWLATDTWGTGQNLRGVEEIAEGAITIALHSPNISNLRPFYEYFTGLRPGNSSRNPWFDYFWQRYFECYLPGNDTFLNYTKTCTGNETYGYMSQSWQDDRIPYVLDSVKALADSLDRMLRNSSGDWDERSQQLASTNKDLLYYLLRTNIEGYSGTVNFDHYGSGIPRYDIMSYARGKYKRLAVWYENETLPDLRLSESDWPGVFESSCQEECGIGEARVILPGSPSCCSRCLQCPETQYVDSSFQCQSCATGQRPNKTRAGCEDLPEGRPALTVVVILVTWAIIGLLMTAFVALTMYRFYSTPLIMATGRELMLVLLAGIAFCYSLGFALSVPPNRRRCAFQRFGSGVFLALCYSAILVKTNRIARIFRGRHRPAFITPAPQLLITALLVSIQLGISLLASFFGTSSEVTRYYTDDYVYLICRTSGMEFVVSISYNVLLVLFCTFYAFLTRKLPANFNEAKLVGMTMYATCVQWILYLPLFYGADPVYRTSVLLLNSCFNATVLLVGMFGHKAYIVWFRPEKNNRQASNPRGRMGSGQSESGHSVYMDDVINGDCGTKR